MTRKGKHPLNALDALSIPDYGALMRDLSPALEVVRQHQEMIKRLTSNPVLEAIRQQDELTRRMLHNPLAEAMREQGTNIKRFTETQSAFETLSLHGSLFNEARKIAAEATGWQDAASRAVAEFRNLIPESAFAEVSRVAEAVRQYSPDVHAFEAAFVTVNFDETVAAVMEQFRRRAQDIASDPEANADDVEAFVAEVNIVAADAPAASRAAMNVYAKYLLWWLLGVLAEDPVKTAAHNALATLLIFLYTLQPIALPLTPDPPVLLAPSPLAAPMPHSGENSALTIPSGRQIEGLPDVIRRAGPKASARTLEFFTAKIRNRNTRQAYAHAVLRFFNWCDDRNLELDDITPFAVAAYVEELQREASAPTVKQHLAGIRMLFDWLVVGQILPMNPASSVRGPKHVVTRGKTPVLTADQARTLLDAIETDTVVGLRDRALIALMVYTFGRVSAAAAMRVEDYFPNGKRWWFRLHEKGGKRHEVPAHHNAESYMDAYLKAAGIADDKKSPLFRTLGRDRMLTDKAMHRMDVLRMIKRRALAADLPASTCCHTFRATGITMYLENGGTIEKAQHIAAHESPRTTKLYDRTSDELTLDEIERIVI